MNMMLSKSMVFLWYLPLWLVVGITLFSCNQDPIFFSISQEVAPKDPRIKGTPTNIVQLDNTVYVASKHRRTVYQYKEGEGWGTISSPGGRILELAATDVNLYALTGDPGGPTQIYQYKDNSWPSIANTLGNSNIQSLYGAGDCVFAGIMTSGGGYEIFYYNETASKLERLKLETKFLTGAAYDGSTYYLATNGDGIYTFNGNNISDQPVTNSAGLAIVGIINVKNQIVAVNRENKILYGTDKNFELKDVSATFTGALGLWREKSTLDPKLLLLGIRGSSTVHGYREIVLNDGTLKTDSMGLLKPGSHSNSSVTGEAKYDSSLGKRSLTALFQAPDSEGTLFAATVKDGLWSYRNNEWNGED